MTTKIATDNTTAIVRDLAPEGVRIFQRRRGPASPDTSRAVAPRHAVEFTLCHLSLARNRDIEKEKWTRFNKKFNRLLAGPLQNTLCELGTISEKDRRSLHVCLPSCRLSLHRVEGRRYSVGFSLCCRREATLQGRQTVQLHADKLAADSVSFVDGGLLVSSK